MSENPTTVTVTINLGDYLAGYDEERERPLTFGDIIAEKAAHHLLDRMERTAVRDLHAQAERITSEEIRAQVTPKIAEALNRSVQRTNSWGEPNGQATTLSEAVLAEAKRLLNEPYGQSSYGAKRQTLVQKLISDEVEKTIRKELNDAMSAAKAEIAEAIKQQGAALITETIQRMAQVRP